MKRKELLALPKLEITEEIREKARQDVGEEIRERRPYGLTYRYTVHEYKRFLRIAVFDEILKIAVFPRRWIQAGSEQPQYEIYLSRKENKYTTYEPATGKWRSAWITNLQYADNYYDKTVWAGEDEKETVLHYLEKEYMTVQAAVLSFQMAVKHKSETDAIDAVMDQIPPLPEDFDDWVLTDGFWNKQYFFYRWSRTKGSAYCTACGQTVEISDKPVHNQQAECPACGRKVTAKAWGKQKCIQDREEIGLIQRVSPEKYVLRRFCCKIERKQEVCWKRTFSGCWEEERLITTPKWGERKVYRWGNFKQTGEMRWCQEKQCKSGDETRLMIYPRNLAELRPGTSLQYIPVERMLEVCHRPFSAREVMITSTKKEWTEYLIKSGLYNLAADGLQSYKRTRWNGKNLTEALGLSRDRINRLKQMNGGMTVYEWLLYEQDTGRKISQEALAYLEEKKIKKGDWSGLLYKTGITVVRMVNYLRKQADWEQAVIEWRDYLRMAEDLHMDLHDDIVRFPKNLKARHDDLVRWDNARKTEEQLAREKEKYSALDAQIAARLPDVRIYFWEDEEYRIIPAGKCQELMAEGRELHHCVGRNDTYMRKMAQGKSWICFLRKKEELEKAYYTIEIDMHDDHVIQWYSAFDRKPDKKTISGVLEKYGRHIKKERRKEKTKIRATA